MMQIDFENGLFYFVVSWGNHTCSKYSKDFSVKSSEELLEKTRTFIEEDDNNSEYFALFYYTPDMAYEHAICDYKVKERNCFVFDHIEDIMEKMKKELGK